MTGIYRIIIAAAVFFILSASVSYAQPGGGVMLEYRGYRSYYGFTRLAFGTGGISPERFRIRYDEPGRKLVFVPMDGGVSLSFPPVESVDDAVSEIDYVQLGDGRLGVVVRLGRAASGYRASYLTEPNRVVIDVFRQARPGQFLPLGREVRKVAIDAGHGGEMQGVAGGDALTEAAVTLELAKRLSAVLGARGYDTVLTRAGDDALTPAQRAGAADSAKADLFVSLHLAQRSGITVLSCDEGFLRPGAPPASGLGWREQQALFLPESLRLARMVADGLGQVKDANVTVHSVRLAGFDGLAMPAVLVELGGFRDKGGPYTDDKYLEMLAAKVADGITSFAGGR